MPGIAVEPRLLNGNLHFARQFRCFTQQFYITNEDLTMKKPNTRKNVMAKNCSSSFFSDFTVLHGQILI